MKGAMLDVLLVSAEGIKNINIIGTPAYHVNIECCGQIRRSKSATVNHDEIYWNEKFTFELSRSELETHGYLKLKIVGEDYFTKGAFVGQTIIFLKGVFLEGNYKALVELNPSPFNVVLEDDTYNGQMTLGLKFIPNIALQMKRRETMQEENDDGKSICRTITSSFWKLQWWKNIFSYRNKIFIDKRKNN
ncbi:elicitor-responsive protein 3 [Henckelia pumila]|uniref:elicitor-responsive protein 3 n=1 Tax=Henckelia pumila TaxID=405737 RepID=UPI003C6E1923